MSQFILGALSCLGVILTLACVFGLGVRTAKETLVSRGTRHETVRAFGKRWKLNAVHMAGDPSPTRRSYDRHALSSDAQTEQMQH